MCAKGILYIQKNPTLLSNYEKLITDWLSLKASSDTPSLHGGDPRFSKDIPKEHKFPQVLPNWKDQVYWSRDRLCLLSEHYSVQVSKCLLSKVQLPSNEIFWTKQLMRIISWGLGGTTRSTKGTSTLTKLKIFWSKEYLWPSTALICVRLKLWVKSLGSKELEYKNRREFDPQITIQRVLFS